MEFGKSSHTRSRLFYHSSSYDNSVETETIAKYPFHLCSGLSLSTTSDLTSIGHKQLFSSQISGPSGDTTSNFTNKVEKGSNVVGSHEVSMVIAKNQLVLSIGKILLVEEIEDQNLLVEELEDHDMEQPIFENYFEGKIGEEGKEMNDSMEFVAELVYEKYIEEEANVIVEEVNDLPLVTKVLQVPKQEIEEDIQNKDKIFPINFSNE